MNAEQCGKILGPCTEFGSRHAGGVIVWVLEDAKHAGRQRFCYGTGHAGETLHEKMHRILAVQIKRATDALRRVRPRIVVVQPAR